MTKDLILGLPYRGIFMGYVIRASDTTALNGIRQLVSINLTPSTLSDAVIDSPVFVRAGELKVYRRLGYITDLSDSSGMQMDGNAKYDADIGSNEVLQAFPITFNYREQYASGTMYAQYDVVRQGSPNEKLYYANKIIASAPSPLDPIDWTEINIKFEGMWSAGVYPRYDVVYAGSPEKLYYANSARTASNTDAPDTDNQWIEITPLASTQTTKQRQFEERVKIASQYQAAIRLILSLPQLLEEQILRERVRFQEIDWEKRIAFYEDETTDILEPIVPDGTIFADATSVFGEVKQFVAF